MEADLSRKEMLDTKGLLYPMLVIAAVSVIILSVFVVATIIDLIPTTQLISAQQQDSRPKTQPQSVQPPVKTARATPTRGIAAAALGWWTLLACGVRQARATHSPTRIAATACDNCGVLATIKAVEVKGKRSGLGMIAGGVTGALAEDQIGKEMTIRNNGAIA